MRKVIATVMLASACFTPAFAQTATPSGEARSLADCQSNFKAADMNGDGVLSKSEMDASAKVVPAALSSMDSISMSQFMLECEGKIPKGG